GLCGSLRETSPRRRFRSSRQKGDGPPHALPECAGEKRSLIPGGSATPAVNGNTSSLLRSEEQGEGSGHPPGSSTFHCHSRAGPLRGRAVCGANLERRFRASVVLAAA